MLFILHTGQTGVERGAHNAARAMDLGIAGFMSRESRDELGRLPVHVSQRLTPCAGRGHRAALSATAQIASAAIIVVPSAMHLEGTTGMRWVAQLLRTHRLPTLVADAETSVADIAAWTAAIPYTCRSRRLLITGPRGTRWPDGETISHRFVTAMGTLSTSPDVHPH